MVGDDVPASYILMNFNDFAAALVTLFALLIVNNWQTMMDATVAICGPAARIFFISWFILGHTLMLNLVVAYVLDVNKASSTTSSTSSVPPSILSRLDLHRRPSTHHSYSRPECVAEHSKVVGHATAGLRRDDAKISAASERIATELDSRGWFLRNINLP